MSFSLERDGAVIKHPLESAMTLSGYDVLSCECCY